MQSWKAQINKQNLDIILLQETHIENEHEAEKLERLWCQVWGIVWSKKITWSFWSHGSTRRAGVAILLNPHTVKDIYKRQTEKTNIHTMIIESEKLRIINTYAPTTGPQQRDYFRHLNNFTRFNGFTIWGGDFNCILEKEWDRIRANKTTELRTTGEAELEAITDLWKLTDSLAIIHRNEQLQLGQYRTAYHTFGNVSSSSRLDRFYVDKELISQIQWQRAIQPGNYSDHKGYVLQLQRHERTKKKELIYKGKDNSSTETQYRIRQHLKMGLQGKHTVETYEYTLQTIVNMLIQESKRARIAKKRSQRRKIRRQARFEGVQPHIIKEKLKKMEEKQRTKRWNRQKRDASHSTEFYNRIQERTPIQHIHDISNSNGRKLHFAAMQVSTADKMAEGWQEIMNPRQATESTALQYQVSEEAKIQEWHNQRLLAPITRKELHKSIQKMKKRKAGGTDKLTNDFFIDYEEELGSWLIETYNDIMETKQMPLSFTEAKIITIPKGGDAQDALQYRPIALLQTPYKIFTRIIADEVLPGVISESQHGFLADRQMEDAINTVQAILTTQHEQQDVSIEDSAVMISLDFAKAYDSLRRDFLWATMEKLGFDDNFIDIIKSIHANTSVQFEVNGQLSQHRRMTVGIRQGCPLAPLLFIIGTEPLTKMIEQDQKLQGIELHDGTQKTEIRIIGYVDDTMLTLQKASMIKRATTLLSQFGAASGLRLQMKKCTGIWLNHAIVQKQFQGYTFLQKDESFRYLGIHITEKQKMPSLNWKRRMDALRRSLAVASTKYTTIEQRAWIINSIAEPQIKFTANYINITKQQITMLQQMLKTFLWTGRLTTDHVTRGKINADIIALPRKQGGLNIKPVAEIIDNQIEKKVFRWALHPPGIKRIIGAVLLSGTAHQQRHPTPILSPNVVKRPGSGTTLWNKGRNIIEYKLAQIANRDEKELQQTQEILHPSNWIIQWRTTTEATLHIPPQAHQQWIGIIRLRWKQIDPIARSYWYMKANNNPWVIDCAGHTINSRWGNQPTLKWYNIQQIHMHSFRIQWLGDPVTQHHVWQQREEYIVLTLLNATGYKPHEQYPSNQALRLINDMSYRQWIRVGHAEFQSGETQLKPTSLNQTIAHPATTCGTANNYVHFELHPLITNIIITEEYGYSYCTRKHHFRRSQRLWATWKRQHLVTLTQSTITNLTRRRKLLEKNEIIQPNNWNHIWNHPYDDASNKLHRYLWFHQAYNIYSTKYEPHCAICHTTESIQHIMWTCKIAQQTWMFLLRVWGMQLIDQNTLNKHKSHIWSDSAPVTSSLLKHLLYKETADLENIHEVMIELWERITLIGKRSLWAWRNRRVWDNAEANIHVYTHELNATVTRELFHLAGHPIPRRATLYQLIHDHHTQHINPTGEVIDSNEHYRMFFDGGSRNNPGHAGSGCVIQKWHNNNWLLIWGTAVYLDHATNNQAELIALLTGLQQTTKQHIRRLTIVGDSQLILNQIENKTKITHQSLRKLHAEVKYHLSQIDHCDFHHTRRSHNKMADSLANLAMDTRITKSMNYNNSGTTAWWLPAKFHEYMDNDTNYTITRVNTPIQPRLNPKTLSKSKR